jgi:hypothetical protein
MKTIISLAIVSILVFPACKKSEIQDIEPLNQSTGKAIEPQKTLPENEEENSLSSDPVKEDYKYY